MDNDKKAELAKKTELARLEKKIASELDQKVRLTEASDPRLEGGIDVNPNLPSNVSPALKTSTAPSSTAKVGLEMTGVVSSGGHRLDNEVTMGDVDQLLSQLDENFHKTLKEVEAGTANVELPQMALESLTISSAYLKGEDEDGDENLEEKSAVFIKKDERGLADQGQGFFSLLIVALAGSVSHPAKGVLKTIRAIMKIEKSQVKSSLRELPIPALSEIRLALKEWRALIRKMFSYSFRFYLLFAVLCLTVGAFWWTVLQMKQGFFHADEGKDPFVKSLGDVANSFHLIPHKETTDNENPFARPLYQVLVRRVVANLKAPNPEEEPMANMELIFDLSNQDAAVEVKQREAEIRGIIERTAEDTTFADLDSVAGKDQFKYRLAAAVNRILNTGRVRRIFFKNISYQE